MAKNEKKSKNKEKKQSHFFKDFKAEIKKVIWPTPKQLLNSTVAVIAMVLIVAAIVFVLDLAFDAFSKYALTDLQETVQSISADDSSDSSNDTDSEDTDTDADSDSDANNADNKEVEEEQDAEE
jgi:preprotein translocase subunit SecE